MQTTAEAAMAGIDQVLHKALQKKAREEAKQQKKENSDKMTQILLLTAYFFK